MFDSRGMPMTPEPIGLEGTPQEYVEKMVAVFRERRRVLRDDGTLWLNLGSSFASGDISPSPSLGDARSCGNDGKAPQDSLDDDHACSGSDGGLRGEIYPHCGHNVHICQPVKPSERQISQTSHDIEMKDSGASSPDVSQRRGSYSNA